MKRSLSILPFALILFMAYSCSSSSSNNTALDGTPRAEDYILVVYQNSVAGTSNQVNVTSNDGLGGDGGGTDNYTLDSNVENGTLNEISDGVFEYVPDKNFSGNDGFIYTLKYSSGDSYSAKVSIIVRSFESVGEEFGVSDSNFPTIDPKLPSFVSVNNTTPEGKKWVKFESMSDEFDTWDGSKWFKSIWNYGVPVFMSQSKENSGVTDGKLWLKATLNESNPEGRWFQTARVHSSAKIKYPMYTEASIKTSHISAFNTYWLNSGDIDDRDEIDIIENNSKPSCNCNPAYPLLMNSQYFQADSSKEPGTIRNDDNFLCTKLSDANPKNSLPWNEVYHTFGVWWKDSKEIQFYLDGEPAGSVMVGKDRSGLNYTDRKFTRDLEIIFDLWTSDANWLGGLPLKSDLADDSINTMRIDWVRTWILEDE